MRFEAPEFVFAPYRDNQAEFSSELEDEWDVAPGQAARFPTRGGKACPMASQ